MTESEIVKATEPKHFEMFEKLDEQQIRAEVEGVFVTDMVYQFESQGRLVTGLSYAGVKELLRFLVRHGYNISFAPVEIEELEKEYRSKCRVVYTAPNGKTLEMWGYSRQPKQFPKGGLNEFAYVQAASKAQRNAGRMIIPEKAATRMLELFLHEGKVRKVREQTEVKEVDVKSETIPEPDEFNLHKVIKWSVKDQFAPIDTDTASYAWLKQNVMKSLSEKHGIIFKEDKGTAGLVQIYSTAMDEAVWNDFQRRLEWVIKTVNNCPPSEVKVWVDEC